MCVGGELWKVHLPSARRVGFGRGGRACESYGDLFARRGVTPDGNGLVSLQHHVAANNGRKLDVGANGRAMKADKRDEQ